MIGRLPDGSKIWGGPYTLTQIVVGVVALIAGILLWPVYASSGLLTAVIILLFSIIVPMYLAGQLKPSTRSPMLQLLGIGKILTAPAAGKIDGKTLKLAKPHHLRWNTTYRMNPAPEGLQEPPVPATPDIRPPVQLQAPAAKTRPPITALERLRAQAGKGTLP